jgi:hypothetical protein
MASPNLSALLLSFPKLVEGLHSCCCDEPNPDSLGTAWDLCIAYERLKTRSDWNPFRLRPRAMRGSISRKEMWE